MGYLGGKSLLGSRIAQQVRCRRRNLQPVFEPFCGMVNVTQHFYPGPVFASDICKPLILCLQAIQNGWEPPDFISEEEYRDLRLAWKEGEESALIGFVGFSCSWSSKWFAGYARGEARNYCTEAKSSLLKRMKHCKHVVFEHKNYKSIEPKDVIIYCDPPYAGTTGYAFGDWDAKTFWKTIRKWSEKNTVIVSEYVAPPDFKIISAFDHFSVDGFSTKQTTEHLFQLKS